MACVDEGSGKPEELLAMISIADGLMKIEMNMNKRFFNVVKHPKVRPTRIEVPTIPPRGLDARNFNQVLSKQFYPSDD